MMKFEQLTQASKEILTHQQTADQAAAKLNAEIGSIDARFQPEIRAAEVAKIREKYTPAINNALRAITQLNDSIRASVPFYESTEFLLSQQPVSKRLNGQPKAPAEDAQLEVTSRLAMGQELAKVSNAQLHLRAEFAKATEQHGLLYLTHLENSSRDASTPDWKPIDISTVDVGQKQALDIIRQSRGIQSTVEQTWKQGMGFGVSAVDRLTAARESAPAPVKLTSDDRLAARAVQI